MDLWEYEQQIAERVAEGFMSAWGEPPPEKRQEWSKAACDYAEIAVETLKSELEQVFEQSVQTLTKFQGASVVASGGHMPTAKVPMSAWVGKSRKKTSFQHGDRIREITSGRTGTAVVSDGLGFLVNWDDSPSLLISDRADPKDFVMYDNLNPLGLVHPDGWVPYVGDRVVALSEERDEQNMVIGTVTSVRLGYHSVVEVYWDQGSSGEWPANSLRPFRHSRWRPGNGERVCEFWDTSALGFVQEVDVDDCTAEVAWESGKTRWVSWDQLNAAN